MLLRRMRWNIGQVSSSFPIFPQNCLAFSSAVDWSERWIQCLLGFHIILFLAVIISRKNADLQTFLFLFIALLVFLSETINSYCATHWKEFSKQNYFDNQGVFIGILFAAPLLAICLFQLVRCRPSYR
jgi:transmembrane protein 18